MERQALQAERKKGAEAAATSAAAAETGPPAIADASTVTTAPSSEVQLESGERQDPVISPVAESVPRSSEEPAETNTEASAVSNSQETPHEDHQHPARIRGRIPSPCAHN